MKILITSDLHGDQEALDHMVSLKDQCDTVFIAGDAQGCGNGAPVRVFDAFAKMEKPVYITPGNHDFWAPCFPESLSNLHKYDNCKVVIDGLVELPNGMTVWFSPWSKPFGLWNWMRPEERGYFIPDCDMIVSHGPCYDICDTCPNGNHAGSREFRFEVFNNTAEFVFTGHIHYDAFPHETVHGVEFYGVAALNERYVFKGKLPIFDTDTEEMKYV